MAVDFNALTVLVVDDEAFSQTIVTKVLSTLGVDNVLKAGNGAEAIEVLETSAETIDLIISDIEMPEMDGFELARKVRYGIVEQYQKIPFLMLTGADTEDNIRKGRIHKIDGFIIKPPKAEQLRDHMVTALAK